MSRFACWNVARFLGQVGFKRSADDGIREPHVGTSSCSPGTIATLGNRGAIGVGRSRLIRCAAGWRVRGSRALDAACRSQDQADQLLESRAKHTLLGRRAGEGVGSFRRCADNRYVLRIVGVTYRGNRCAGLASCVQTAPAAAVDTAFCEMLAEYCAKSSDHAASNPRPLHEASYFPGKKGRPLACDARTTVIVYRDRSSSKTCPMLIAVDQVVN